MNSKIKDFTREITTIFEVENLNSQSISIIGMPGISKVDKVKKEFQLFFKGVFHYPKNGKVKIRINNELYKIGSSDFHEAIPGHKDFQGIECEHTFDIDRLQKGSLKNGTDFRMFFFDTSKKSNLFHYKLEAPKHDGVIPWAFNCVRVDLDGIRYDIVQHKAGKNSFFIIENLDPVSYTGFKRDSYAIQKGIGFLVGYMPGGEHYIFSGESFEYYRLARESLKSIYHPVTRNPHSFPALHKHKKIADDYEKKLVAVPSAVISTFIMQIRENQDLSVALLFLMEVSHMKSVVSMPGVFSVVLESMANVIINPLKIKTNLIPDTTIAQEIIEELNLVLDRYSSKLNEQSLPKLRRRLTALNSPVNPRKITNAMKLREPFDQLGIRLSPLDEQAIDYRNYLLHGNILMNDGTARSSKETDNHMMYISAKLYTLLSKLLLKNCGFSGYVINHAKFHESKKTPKEPHYFEAI